MCRDVDLDLNMNLNATLDAVVGGAIPGSRFEDHESILREPEIHGDDELRGHVEVDDSSDRTETKAREIARATVASGCGSARCCCATVA